MPRKPVMNYSLKFRVPGTGRFLHIAATVLAHFDAYKQRRWYSLEAGGQLFATLGTENTIEIVEATGPRPTDKRSRYGYEPDRIAERREIDVRYDKGLHFIGDWHTHPEYAPKPSGTDNQNIQAVVRASRHDQPGFFLIVVGLADFPDGIHASFHSANVSRRLNPTLVEASTGA